MKKVSVKVERAADGFLAFAGTHADGDRYENVTAFATVLEMAGVDTKRLAHGEIVDVSIELEDGA